MPASLLDSLMQQSEADVRAKLNQVRSPALFRLRADVTTIPTSGLIMAMVTGGAQLMGEEEIALPQPELEVVIAATMMLLGDEIDRRFPIPK
jgi:hypothetical protein